MLVIQGSFTTPPTGIPAGTVILPAENCVWGTPAWNDTTKKYSIGAASFVQGTTATTINNAKLGFINKSGSFNAIA